MSPDLLYFGVIYGLAFRQGDRVKTKMEQNKLGVLHTVHLVLLNGMKLMDLVSTVKISLRWAILLLSVDYLLSS